jgi:hypothetical protein
MASIPHASHAAPASSSLPGAAPQARRGDLAARAPAAEIRLRTRGSWVSTGGLAHQGKVLMIRRIAPALAALMVLAATPAGARELFFKANLSGAAASTATGSRATGQARIVVDTDAQTVDVALNVEGLKIEDLWTNLLHSAMGAIHLHVYGSRDHGGGADSALMFPLPYGPDYVATPRGFKVEMKAEPYAAGARLVNSRATFDEFVAALSGGRIVVNIHTNSKTDGEISGDVAPA